jgi:hypothetical protein
MGNRAVIAIKCERIQKELTPSIYLHWNGGRDSVESILKAANIIGIRWGDPTYACARLSQIIGNWMKGILSLGVGAYGILDTDNYDNGVYWVSNGEITEREFVRNDEQYNHDQDEMVNSILEANMDAFPEAIAKYYAKQSH